MKTPKEHIPLSQTQREIIKEFYTHVPTKVILNKTQRNDLWKVAIKRSKEINFTKLKKECPALEYQILQSYKEGHNIQSAVFSECVYAQTYANMLHLDIFVNYLENKDFIPTPIINLLHSFNLFPPYAYSTIDKQHMLFPAGVKKGHTNILLGIKDFEIYTIEFKEPGAKTSEPDLPKYKENGKLIVTADFLKRYPQFKEMLEEQKELNFFKVMGSNVHNFSVNSIDSAVSNNYTNPAKKYADVICTEDTDGYLVMLPANQVTQWAEIEGEIRPAGRNHYPVWTPKALLRFLKEKGAIINKTMVSIEKVKLDLRKARGGAGKISGYKINPLFFVYAENCKKQGTKITFDIPKVRQLNPTIAAKMFFKNLKYSKIKNFYKTQL